MSRVNKHNRASEKEEKPKKNLRTRPLGYVYLGIARPLSLGRKDARIVLRTLAKVDGEAYHP